MTDDRNITLIASVQRALSLVDVVANARRPLPVKALSSASGLTLGTTYNIVRTLIHEGYLLAEPDGLVLGSRFPSMRERDEGVFLAKVRETLRLVTEETGVTAYLSRFDDGEVHLIDIVDTVRSPRIELWVGLHDSAHATALGKQVLRELDDEQRLDYLSRHPLVELTPNTIRDRRALLEQLERPASAMLDREEYSVGNSCVAVPVRAPGVIASLAVSVPSDLRALASLTDGRSPDLDALTSTLRRAAARLSLRLGSLG